LQKNAESGKNGLQKTIGGEKKKGQKGDIYYGTAVKELITRPSWGDARSRRRGADRNLNSGGKNSRKMQRRKKKKRMHINQKSK